MQANTYHVVGCPSTQTCSSWGVNVCPVDKLTIVGPLLKKVSQLQPTCVESGGTVAGQTSSSVGPSLPAGALEDGAKEVDRSFVGPKFGGEAELIPGNSTTATVPPPKPGSPAGSGFPLYSIRSDINQHSPKSLMSFLEA